MPRSAKKVYLMHGWAANRHVFSGLIPHLPVDWQIRAPDLSGRDDAPSARPFNITTIAETFAAQVDAPAHILGWSLGGLVVLHLTAFYPDGIHSLYLTTGFARLAADTDYPEGLVDPVLGKMVGAFRQDYAKYIKQLLQLQLSHISNSAEILHRILPDLSRRGTSVALRTALDTVSRVDTHPLLARIRTPSPLVFGQKDVITPPRIDEYLNRHLTDSELVLMEKVAHAPFLNYAGEFAERYRDFVEKAV